MRLNWGYLLTNTEVRKAKVKRAAYRLSDGRGLYLAVTPAGGNLWRWKYRFQGTEKLMSFGRYPTSPRERSRAACGSPEALGEWS